MRKKYTFTFQTTNEIMNIVKEIFDSTEQSPPQAKKVKKGLESNTYRVALLGPLIVNSLSRACAA